MEEKAMCEFSSKEMKKQARDHYANYTKPQRETVFSHLREKFRNSFNPGQCFSCGKYLSPQEKKPPGRATRSMCNKCYEEQIANTINHDCFLCDFSLPDEKIMEQVKNPREIRAHMHEGTCVNAFVILHNIALEEPEVFSRNALPMAQHDDIRSRLISNQQPILLEDGINNDFRIPDPKFHKGLPVKVIKSS